MKKRKLILALLMAVATTMALVGLSGCAGGNDARSAITDDLKGKLEVVKNLDDEGIATLKESMGSTSASGMLGSYNLTTEQLISGFFDGFDYDIVDVEVNEEKNTATAVFTVRCKSMDSLTSQLSEKVEALQDDEATRALSANEIKEKIGEVVLSTLDSIEPQDSDEITVDYTYADGTWTTDDNVYGKIANYVY